MLGLHLPSASKAALVAVASVMLSLGATASYADDAQEIATAREGAHFTAPHSDARAMYPGRDVYSPTQGVEPRGCVGGYRWQEHVDELNDRTPGQLALPLPCR